MFSVAVLSRSSKSVAKSEKMSDVDKGHGLARGSNDAMCLPLQMFAWQFLLKVGTCARARAHERSHVSLCCKLSEYAHVW